MFDTFLKFVKSEQTGGILLIFCTAISLLITNSSWGNQYLSFWEINLGMSLHHWINDGLMAVFFLLVGLEIKRELIGGELSSISSAAMPVMAAIGGMLFPAVLFLTFNYNQPSASGWGIPMATDIAFALGMLSLLGNRVPVALKVFLVAVAVVDDLGAILVIALFYAHGFSWMWFGAAMVTMLVLILLNRSGSHKLLYFLIPGVLLWYFILQSGIHATIAGVLLALTIPINKDEKKSMLHHIEHAINKPVALFIMPIFALANTGIILEGDLVASLTSPVSYGILAGLIIGKPVGILLFTWLSVKTGWSTLPQGVTWAMIAGAAMLGGIGFTMSIFISTLAFDEIAFTTISKISILAGSATCAILGLTFLKFTFSKSNTENSL
ncbi:MAG: Na+/H+ antiporter NhaA [Bacteroidetes bacterium]|nr:Na+/H+ antiporter NhaA [Bacteroidota bacterium]